MIGGWVKAHRSRFDNPLFTKPYCRGYAWDWLCAAACHEPTRFNVKGRTVTVQRGQLATSYRALAEAWGWSLGAVQRFVARLKTDTMVETATDTGQLIITICNYNTYQSKEKDTDTETDTPADTGAIQERYTKEEGKEGEEYITPPVSPPSGGSKNRGSRLPADWQLTEPLRRWAVEQGLTAAEADREAEQFRDHWTAATGKGAAKKDWDAAWRTWVRNAIKWRPRQRRGEAKREVRDGQSWLEYDDAFGGGPVVR